VILVLAEMFYWVLNISVLGGATGLIIFLVGKIPRIPRFAAYVLWLIPLFRFWIPFGFASRWSLLNFISKYTSKTIIIWRISPDLPVSTWSNFVQAADSYAPVVYKTVLLQRIFELASVIWLVIAIVLLLCLTFMYVLSKRDLKDAQPLDHHVWISSRVSTPAVYGIFKPKIILPDGFPRNALSYILAHENVHIRRRDNFWRMVAISTACVHWFNPLSWLFLQWFFTDMELACDSKVLKMIGEESAKDYAAALLSCAAHQPSFTSAFGGVKTRIRIERILSYKRLTLLSTAAFSLFLISVSFVLMTNAVGG
jgi:beta-lactamase regulating signal transducer with metallopeptidase domain